MAKGRKMMINLNDVYPKEHFFKLNGLPDYLVGRVTLYQGEMDFSSEIDIIQRESGKIYNHVKVIHKYEDVRELLSESIHQLSQYLKGHQKR